MSWHGIHGHDDVVDQFRRALRRGRLASSFLFVGPAGIGKRTFALKLAQGLLCQTHPEKDLDPCGTCPSCLQVAAQTHPDLEVIGRPKDKAFLPLELLIGDKEHRLRQGLCHRMALKPFMGGRKVAVIDDADHLNAEGANSLLKTLEEPPPHSVLILVGTSVAKQLPTVRSRCQLVRFRPLPTSVVAELLVAQQVVEDATEANRLAGFSEGSFERACRLADPGLLAFRTQLYRRLADSSSDSGALAKELLEQLESAGRQPAARRERFRLLIGLAADFYRHLLRGLSGAAASDDVELQEFLGRILEHWPGGVSAAACLDRCLQALEQVDRNANQATLVEGWLADLAVTAATRRVTDQ